MYFLHYYFCINTYVINDNTKSWKRHITSILSLIFFLKSLFYTAFKTSVTRQLTDLIVTSMNIAISAHGEKRKTIKLHCQFQNNWGFSDDVTKIQTTNLLILLRFTFTMYKSSWKLISYKLSLRMGSWFCN